MSAPDHLCGLSGVEMALTKGRSPASDWHQGDVDVRQILERDVRTSVPGIPAPAGALDQIAECGSAMRAPRVSPAVMVGCQDVYPQAAELHEVTRLDLGELQAAGGDWLEQPARACRDERTAEAGISRSEGRWVWSACKWEIRMRSA